MVGGQVVAVLFYANCAIMCSMKFKEPFYFSFVIHFYCKALSDINKNDLMSWQQQRVLFVRFS